MGILLTIIIGFVAGIIAKFLYPGRTNPKASSSQPSSASWVHLPPPSSVRPWVGIRPTRGLD